MFLRMDNISSTRTIDMVVQLKAAGFEPGKDFDFAWIPSDPNAGPNGPACNFTFFNSAAETWFRLKYS